MKKYCSSILLFLIVALALCLSLECSAQVPPKPLWVIKGVKHLNEHRVSKDYEFISFHHDLSEQPVVNEDRMLLLRNNMASYFNVTPDAISIDSIYAPSLSRTTYEVSFPTPGKEEITRLYVQPVDSYRVYDDNIDGTFDYKLDELYAISAKDEIPDFDNFKVTRQYNGLPVAMSLIPGLGQIYKGQAAKGYSILGAEAVFCAAIAFGEINRSYYMKQAREHSEFYDSWKSKANGYRAVRNVGIIFASATYLYNILDAAFAKGAPHVIISRNNSSPADMVIVPFASQGFFGAALSLTF